MTTIETHHRNKNPPTCGSTPLANVAYIRSWREKIEVRIPDSQKSHERGKAFAAEDVNDLRPLRGALRASLTSFLASAGSQ